MARRAVLLTLILYVSFPSLAAGQLASLEGRMTDSTGAVLVGVRVVGVHELSGSSVTTHSGDIGEYRFAALRVGVYTLTVDLPGFAALRKSGVEVMVGQRAVMDLELQPSDVRETVHVVGAPSPLRMTESKLGGNIDARQVEVLPMNGRDWLQLALLATGNRLAASGDQFVPGHWQRADGTAQLNVDGQQVSQGFTHGSVLGQARISREAIAEFEFVSSRFDATQGRANNVQINAVTKAGGNDYQGTLTASFRDDRLIAKDFVADRVLPYSNQQIAATFGGPIARGRAHFFGYMEYERSPRTLVFNSPYPTFNVDLNGTDTQTQGGGRLDYQVSARTHLMARAAAWRGRFPFGFDPAGGATVHPSTKSGVGRDQQQALASGTQVFGQAVNEIKVGYSGYRHSQGTPFYAPDPSSANGAPPLLVLLGYTIGGGAPATGSDKRWSVREDFSALWQRRGRHEVKTGGEYLYSRNPALYQPLANGQYDMTGGSIPANIEALFPVWNDPTTWNLAPLSPITRSYSQSFASSWDIKEAPRHTFAVWFQDNWSPVASLTLNLGVRYDVAPGSLGENLTLPPFRPHAVAHDLDNVQPRLGFAYVLPDERTVLRGGAGRYYADLPYHYPFQVNLVNQITTAATLNDGRPDFAGDPWGGPAPSFDDILQRTVVRDLFDTIPSSTVETPYSYQSSIGFQRQLGSTTTVEADYAYIGTRHDSRTQNINLAFDPATGANYPFSDISSRPYAGYGIVPMFFTNGWSDYHALQTSVTRRMSNRWRATATYTLSRTWDTDDGLHSTPDNVFAPLAREYAPSLGDQRHRAVVSGIWELPAGFLVSGLYYYGSGFRYPANYGGDLRDTGGWSPGRLRPDGTIVPRNSFVGRAVQRLDLRVSRKFRFFNSASIEGTLEVFNVFNHANYNSYVVSESSAAYGQPQQDSNVAFSPRMLQFGFRVLF